jgi:hypothetical protein
MNLEPFAVQLISIASRLALLPTRCMQKTHGIAALRSVGFLSGVGGRALKALAASAVSPSTAGQPAIIGHSSIPPATCCSCSMARRGQRLFLPGGRRGELATSGRAAFSARWRRSTASRARPSIGGDQRLRGGSAKPQAAFIAASAASAADASRAGHLTGQVRVLTARVFEFSTPAVRSRVHSEPRPLCRDDGTFATTWCWRRRRRTRTSPPASAHPSRGGDPEITHLERLGIVQRQGANSRSATQRSLRALSPGNRQEEEGE